MKKSISYLLHCLFNGSKFQRYFLIGLISFVIVSAHRVSASDDIVEPELTRRLLRDLREVRQAKARKGIETIGDTHLQMDNLGMMEINEIRFLNHALDRLRMLSTAKYSAEEKESVDFNDDFGSTDDSWEN